MKRGTSGIAQPITNNTMISKLNSNLAGGCSHSRSPAGSVFMCKECYDKLKASGMMWEFHPEFNGDYENDRSWWEINRMNKEQLREIHGMADEEIEAECQKIQDRLKKARFHSPNSTELT